MKNKPNFMGEAVSVSILAIFASLVLCGPGVIFGIAIAILKISEARKKSKEWDSMHLSD